MLNELQNLVTALDRSGTSYGSPHPALFYMGKGDALHVFLDDDGKPSTSRIIPGDRASKLMRVAPASNGPAFPGFNIPKPLRVLTEEGATAALPTLTRLCSALKSKTCDAAELVKLALELWAATSPRTYTKRQSEQFTISVNRIPQWLASDLNECPPGFESFSSLLKAVIRAKPSLDKFVGDTAAILFRNSDTSREDARFLCEVIFGSLPAPTAEAGVNSAEWWNAKRKADEREGNNVPTYLDLETRSMSSPIASPGFWLQVNAYFNKLKPAAYKAEARKPNLKNSKETARGVPCAPATFVDAFSGRPCEVPDTFPEPKVAKLGGVRLFSNNTDEAKCFIRYGLEGSETFAMSEARAQQMAGALAYVGAEAKLGKTCRAVPSASDGKQDLLIAYLDAEPDTDAAFAEVMGGTLDDDPESETGFEPQAAAVLELLDAKLVANPDLRMQLFSIAVLDKANRQVSLCRSFPVAGLVNAVKRWSAGHRAVTGMVSLFAYDRTRKAATHWHPPSVFPLDLAALANKVWTSSDKAGLASSFNRVLTSGDAFDVFLQDSQRAKRTLEIALTTLVQRTRSLFSKGGEYKTKRDFKLLGDVPRRELLKAISLLSILIQLHPTPQTMKEPTYYLGRLLACADALHFEYCKRVRGGETPTQLIGNALFNTALEQPVFALARLAERLTPYKAWATTYKHVPKDEGDKGGLEKWLLGRIAECCAQFIETDTDSIKRIRAEELPAKMTDIDKAKLMLGYMADLHETKA